MTHYPAGRAGSQQDAAPFFYSFTKSQKPIRIRADFDLSFPLMTILLLISVFTISFLLTALVRKIAKNNNLIDTPNHRSAHTIPTPRGGGLAIAVSFLLGISALLYLKQISVSQWTAFFGSGFLVSAIGFLDDKYSLSPLTRLVTQVLAAIWGIYWLGGFPGFSVFGFTVENIVLLSLVGILSLVWLTNLYNFMDGINGIATIQAITVGFGMTLLGYLGDLGGSIDLLPALAGFASCGFLYWNFPKAKIFMGDVGSSFLGLTLGLIAVNQAHKNPDLLFGFLILMAVFFTDATWTLFRRLLGRQKVYQAHASHAYQRAARKCQSHTKVSLTAGAINILWLLPISIAGMFHYIDLIFGLALAYLPVVIVVIGLKAGVESQSNKG